MFGKEKKRINNIKKVSKGDDVVINANGVRMKGVVIGETVDGITICPSPIECPKEFKNNKLKKLSDCVPIMIVNLIKKGLKSISTTKETKCCTHP